jgi:hypothetical protein
MAPSSGWAMSALPPLWRAISGFAIAAKIGRFFD